MFTVKDKIVLITGGARGIGAAIAKEFVCEGAKIVLVLDINETIGISLAEQVNSHYGEEKIQFIKCDVTKDLDSTFQSIAKKFGYIDVMVNNAGISNEDLDSFPSIINVNFIAAVNGSMKAFYLMRKDKGGRGGTIINISSTTALRHNYLCPLYSGTKSGLLKFSWCLGMEPRCIETGVRVLTMCIGLTKTELGAHYKGLDEQSTKLLTDYMNKRGFQMQSPKAVAEGIMVAYKQGLSPSVWLIVNGQSAKDISDVHQKAYKLYEENMTSCI